MMRKCLALSLSALLFLAGCGTTPLPSLNPPAAPIVATTPQAAIKHVVVIFGENISFDHYFGTYPNAANTGGTSFTAAAGTPTNINNYSTNPTLLTANPNLNAANLVSASNSVPSITAILPWSCIRLSMTAWKTIAMPTRSACSSLPEWIVVSTLSGSPTRQPARPERF